MKKIKALYRILRIMILRIISCIYNNSLPHYKNILIIAPHPDDEVLGCGGLIVRQIENGEKVSVIILTAGEASHGGCCTINPEVLKQERIKLSKNAAKIAKLSLDNLYLMNFADGCITLNDRENIDKLKKLIEEINPDAIFVTNMFEKWNDHLNSARIVKELIIQKKIDLYHYCVWIWYYMPLRKIFKINWREARIITLSTHEIEMKEKMITCYMEPKAPCGRAFSGELPRILIQSAKWKKELYFKQ